MRSSYLIAFVAGCSFSTSVNNTEPGNDASPMKDSSMPGGEMVPPDARVCFGAGFGMTCLPTAPMQPRQLSNTNNFDTNTASNCTHIITIGTVETCVLTGTTVTMPGGGTFRAVGPRPLVIVAATTIEIMGNVSVSSLRGQGSGAGASTATCPTAEQGEDDSGGGGGGAGGTYVTKGGNGGLGDTNGSPGNGGSAANAMAVPTTIRGGCGAGRGGNSTQNGGSGGAGGGAVYLIAGTSIQISGGVFAGGAGGNSGGTRGGGGGGGSGGFVGLDAPTVTITGAVTANGGGGGEGGGFGAGQSGSDATTNDQRAPGGANEPDGGNGGGGGALVGTTGGTGGNSDGGGGGGGGGTGYIYVKGTLGGAGTISPAASVF